MSKRILRGLQRPHSEWAARGRNFLQPEGSANHDWTIEETLHHQAPAQRLWFPTTSTRNHRPNGPQASHALTIKTDRSSRLDHMGEGQSADQF